ncbi:MAG: inositol monophosphatase [Treponema sp.]|nr:inositol monophosphatase [Treponema sp.]
MDYEKLLAPVKRAALEAAKSIARNSAGADTPARLETRRKGPNDFVTKVDLEISEYLMAALPALLEGSVVISEESAENLHSTAAQRWIIDPIDGTNNIIFGAPFYAISIGLTAETEPVLGCVLLPATGELFSAAKGGGALAENLYSSAPPKAIRVQQADSLGELIVMAETDPYFDRNSNRSVEVIQAVFRRCIDCRITGAAAIDYSYIAAGRAGVHFCRNLNAWDYAGGAAILAEAGGVMSQWDGTPLTYRSKHSSLACCGRAVHEEMLELLEEFCRPESQVSAAG